MPALRVPYPLVEVADQQVLDPVVASLPAANSWAGLHRADSEGALGRSAKPSCEATRG